MTFVGLIPPVWIVVVVLGVIWLAVSSVVLPPAIHQVPLLILGAIGGAAIGQIVATTAAVADPHLGDAHLAGIAVGALLAIAVVRRLTA